MITPPATPPAAPPATPPAEATATQRGAMSAVVVVLFVVASGVLGWTWGSMSASSASFADRQVFDDNQLGTGTVDIALGDDTVDFVAMNMAAGDATAGQLELLNNGTLALGFTLSATSNDVTLADVLDLVAWSGAPGCSERPSSPGELWRPLADGDNPPPGDAAPSSGRLAPDESLIVCLAGDLPLSAPNSIQGQRLDVRITVRAEHDLAADAQPDLGSEPAS